MIFLKRATWRERFGASYDNAISNGPAFLAALRPILQGVPILHIDFAESLLMAAPLARPCLALRGMVLHRGAGWDEGHGTLNQDVMGVDRQADAAAAGTRAILHLRCCLHVPGPSLMRAGVARGGRGPISNLPAGEPRLSRRTLSSSALPQLFGHSLFSALP
jgi:hypothetical protein